MKKQLFVYIHRQREGKPRKAYQWEMWVTLDQQSPLVSKRLILLTFCPYMYGQGHPVSTSQGRTHAISHPEGQDHWLHIAHMEGQGHLAQMTLGGQDHGVQGVQERVQDHWVLGHHETVHGHLVQDLVVQEEILLILQQEILQGV